MELTPFQTIIPLLIPAAIAGLKWFWPRVPKVLLPVLAPILGACAEIAAQQAGAHPGNIYLSVGLGACGVWLREAFDQSRKLIAPPDLEKADER